MYQYIKLQFSFGIILFKSVTKCQRTIQCSLCLNSSTAYLKFISNDETLIHLFLPAMKNQPKIKRQSRLYIYICSYKQLESWNSNKLIMLLIQHLEQALSESSAAIEMLITGERTSSSLKLYTYLFNLQEPLALFLLGHEQRRMLKERDSSLGE